MSRPPHTSLQPEALIALLILGGLGVLVVVLWLWGYSL